MKISVLKMVSSSKKILFLIILLIFVQNGTSVPLPKTFGKVGSVIRNCLVKERTLGPFWSCIKSRGYQEMKTILDYDVLDIYNGLKLVKTVSNQTNADPVDNEISSRSDDKSLFSKILNKFGSYFKNHVLQLDLNDLVETGRRHPHHRAGKMMPIMMFGITVLGVVLVPMGFQFLAVLGGKALLLSKMALLLASMQGLKKVATTSFAHGLYAAPPPNPYYEPQIYDRSSSDLAYAGPAHSPVYELQKRYK